MRGGTPAVAARLETASRKRPAMMLVAGVAAIGVLAGGWFAFGPRPPVPSPAPSIAAETSVAAAIVPAAAPPPDHTREELEQARREQKAALEEAARLRTEAETRRKVDEEAALRRKIEEELRQKAEADEAARRQAAEEAKRQADAQAAALAAAQHQAEEEAKSKAQAEAEARLKAEEADRKGAEAAEAALRLTQVDRQRIQVALTALGFGTAGSDGVLGPRSREMIAAWQKKNGRAATGYLAADTQAALLREAGPALARYDEEQKKLAETPTPPPQPSPQPAAGTSVAAAQDQVSAAKGATQCEGIRSSQWCRGAFQGFPSSCWNVPMTVRKGEIFGSWVSSSGSTEPQTFSGRINAGGEVQLTYNGIGQQTYTNQHFTVPMAGRVADGILTASGRAGQNGRDFTVRVQCR
jgi:peptidoglycan hydrolase-like protein with peptidoglycan-binding domain